MRKYKPKFSLLFVSLNLRPRHFDVSIPEFVCGCSNSYAIYYCASHRVLSAFPNFSIRNIIYHKTTD